ncbi:MAG TPA: hypothetical protein VFU02_05745 [Polyangiaceae bacterium]|nr:hypothetical protein [Polyangiaceae bacterium]
MIESRSAFDSLITVELDRNLYGAAQVPCTENPIALSPGTDAGHATHQLGYVGRQHLVAYLIKTVLPLATLIDQASPQQFPYMVRNRPLRNPRLGAQLLARVLAFASDRLEQSHPPRV